MERKETQRLWLGLLLVGASFILFVPAIDPVLVATACISMFAGYLLTRDRRER